MRNYANQLTILLFMCAIPCWATQYYISPTGNDGSAGTSTGTAWLTPNHAVNCGDNLQAAAGTYTNTTSFNYGSFGAVTGTHPCVAIIQCITAFACTVNGGGQPLVWFTASHWGIMGFVFTQTSTSNNYGCVQTTPPSGTLTDFLVANNVFNGCYGSSVSLGGATDYVAVVGNAVYNAAEQSSQCASGISMVGPKNFDTLPGTHIYIAQNFIWGNNDPNPCAGSTPTDGEGVILDTWSLNSYTGQGVVENNIAVYNGSNGFEVWNSGGATNIYVDHNTSYANNGSASRSTALCGEFTAAVGSGTTQHVESYANIAKTNAATACGSNTLYAFLAWANDATNPLYKEWGYSAAGNNQACTGTCTGYSPGPGNTFGTDPAFVSAPGSVPSAPSCGSYSTVPACMATLIAQMTPTAAGTAGLGYQPVGANNYNPLYPHWLCTYSSQLSGILTQGCVTASAKTGVTINVAGPPQINPVFRNVWNTNQQSASAGTVTASIAIAGGSGHIAIGYCRSATNTSLTISDPSNGNWTNIGTLQNLESTYVQWAWVSNPVAITGTLTCTLGTNGTYRGIAAAEYSGFNATQTLDSTAQTFSGCAFGSGTCTSSSFSDHAAKELVVWFGDFAAAGASAGSMGANTPTMRTGAVQAALEDTTFTSTQSGITASATPLSGSGSWEMAVLGFY